ncbi:rRNA maturation RNase YbeY [Paracoccus sp. SCSIO 75233]|uniref:rRNA maturation RNase YbeY n=1 Tax=Paracoccus sp. SCSIO 75233 TaxID=3017782 RepID=UPI0022F0FA89|nr:rRNA maturation RNase YbeY [Paracoccus sp. SCSIO 75233]WBU54241.1 rRNA maturation RNase YbeY [Paracoccus sp. SCSIO 75233]
MADIDVVIEDDRWIEAGLDALAQRAGQAALNWLGMDADICIMGCDDTRIAALNGDFRDKPQPTNVLSWPAVEHVAHPPGAHPPRPDTDELGDIAIAWETCQREATVQGKAFDAHVTHLLVHAILHLAGYDHLNDVDAETMEAAERSVLQPLGIDDPYLERTR